MRHALRISTMSLFEYLSILALAMLCLRLLGNHVLFSWRHWRQTLTLSATHKENPATMKNKRTQRKNSKSSKHIKRFKPAAEKSETSVCESQTEGNGFVHRQRNEQNPDFSDTVRFCEKRSAAIRQEAENRYQYHQLRLGSYQQ